MNWHTIASIQPPYFDEKSHQNNEKSIQAGLQYLKEALNMGASVACLPEFFNILGVADAEMHKTSQNADLIHNEIRALAAKHSAYIILPLLEEKEGSFFNRAYLVGPDGQDIGHYDKTQTTLSEREYLSVSAGNSVKVFETEIGKIGIVICYDIYFPEIFNELRQQKVDIIFFPSLQRAEHETANESLIKARAMDTQAYLVRSSFGRPINTHWQPGMMFGQSSIIHPDGTVLANAGHFEGMGLARIKLPFEWKKPRCSGYPVQSVRDYLDDDRKS
ncbi:MAG: carbon-nitrogen hydrolase family protein [Opitutaceae bacterium]|nr:carbon-nitrogen hydrolase family protein [Opitutaceae bacterium]